MLTRRRSQRWAGPRELVQAARGWTLHLGGHVGARPRSLARTTVRPWSGCLLAAWSCACPTGVHPYLVTAALIARGLDGSRATSTRRALTGESVDLSGEELGEKGIDLLPHTRTRRATLWRRTASSARRSAQSSCGIHRSNAEWDNYNPPRLGLGSGRYLEFWS